MSASHFILLIETDPSRSAPLAAQLVRLGIEPICVSDLDAAIEVVQSRQYVVSAVLLPSEILRKDLRKAQKSLCSDQSMLPCMAYGKAPDRAQRKHLRRAGVLLALWDGYDAGMLRFQINRLVSELNQPSVRAARRAPIHMPVRVQIGDREKDGFLYSLSECGCFIETPRASMDGARLRLLFALEEEELEIDGLVAFANVPGNLQKPNLPLGMGVRFDNVSKPVRKTVARFIQERMASLEV